MAPPAAANNNNNLHSKLPPLQATVMPRDRAGDAGFAPPRRVFEAVTWGNSHIFRGPELLFPSVRVGPTKSIQCNSGSQEMYEEPEEHFLAKTKGPRVKPPALSPVVAPHLLSPVFCVRRYR